MAISAVETGRLALLEHLAPLALDDRVINRLEVVLEELVSNVVRHAGLATGIKLSASTLSDGIVICLEDDGGTTRRLRKTHPSVSWKMQRSAVLAFR